MRQDCKWGHVALMEELKVIQCRHLKECDQLEEQGVGWRIILKCIINTQGMRT
jgi:hypothetical protein